MRLILGSSALSTNVSRSRRRLVFFALEVRIWRMNACPRFTRPLAVFLKRLAAPLWILSFGIVPLQTIQSPSSVGAAGDSFKYISSNLVASKTLISRIQRIKQIQVRQFRSDLSV